MPTDALIRRVITRLLTVTSILLFATSGHGAKINGAALVHGEAIEGGLIIARTAAGKIVTHGPYKSVSDIYAFMNEKEKAATKKYESRLITLEPSAMYVIDRVNNGLYR